MAKKNPKPKPPEAPTSTATEAAPPKTEPESKGKRELHPETIKYLKDLPTGARIITLDRVERMKPNEKGKKLFRVKIMTSPSQWKETIDEPAELVVAWLRAELKAANVPGY